MPDANLLITFDPAHSKKAEDEVRTLLKQAGENAKFLPCKIEGVFLLRTKKEPRGLVKQLRKLGQAKNVFVNTFRWTPIDKWVKTDVKSLGKALKDFDKKMDPAKSWKLDLAKRRFDKASATELVLKLTENINKPKVDLENPDVIIKVEVMGSKTGLALLASDEILDTTALK